MATKARKANHERTTKETVIKVDLVIEGTGQFKPKAPKSIDIKKHKGIDFLFHMLELFTFHGLFDLTLEIKKADIGVDFHHTNEDIGIVLGIVFKKALANKGGIKRFGSAFAPMESTLGHTVIDICGRGHSDLELNGQTADTAPHINHQYDYTFQYLHHFLESFAKQLGATIIVNIKRPGGSIPELHEVVETVFKSLGLALDQATTIDPRRKTVPSTKGIID
ncbi:MAG: hypothetical protein A2787_05890 [Omnitrophica WOR_2 bacterium RIFCSPHIGHO2_01_FULL_48_9]|nr:MAG: hypothetical protein A3D10_05885 [Omnitrophica WOR_2 bacterium RIFCSPHIGHO2_02_FULL_48_11]OGX33918.1 MAG: hypothetical protein A2787_05890 [Omnitrophica WOR_2 bacterium RIFCSPHIGHO2_01_FULL_48_9]